MNKPPVLFTTRIQKRDKVRVLLIEAGPEMEMGIPFNMAVLVSAVRKAGFMIDVFSVNDYRFNGKTGDEARIETLQVPPVSEYEISTKPKEGDMFSDFQERIEAYKPDIVGLSSASEATYEPGLKLLQSIEDKKIFTIAGGVYPTLCPEDVIAEDSVYAVCVGEGEYPLVELCESIQNKQLEYNIKNLWFKIDSQVIKNPMRPLNNLDDIPFQDWSPWNIPPRGIKAMAGEIRTTALVEFSRGCPFKCNFCANYFLNQTFKGNYRERSVSRFVEEIQYLKKRYKLGFVYIVDETILTTSEKRFLELIDKYTAVKVPFWCQSRPESISYKKMKLLKEVGLQAINVGIESGNQKFRKKNLNRSSTDDQIINGVRQAVEAGVRIGANAIIGFPGETRKHIFETIELVREANPSSTMVHLFQPYKKTPLREECIKMGLIKEDHICGDYRMEGIGTGTLSAEELLGLQKTFNLYVDFSKDRWDEIREAESFDVKGNATFRKLAREYQLKHFGRASF